MQLGRELPPELGQTGTNKGDEQMKTRCSFVDPNGFELPDADNGWAYFLKWPGIPDGYNCPAHAKTLEQLEQDGELD